MIQFGIPKKWAMGPEGIFFAILFCVCGVEDFLGHEDASTLRLHWTVNVVVVL